MQNISYLILSTLILTTNTPAQDYAMWSLSEVAKARLWKGQITGNVAYSPDGSKFAVASIIDVWIYDAQTGQELDLYSAHTDDVKSISFSPNGSTLASVSFDGTIRLWDTSIGSNIRTLRGHTAGVRSVTFSPDGNTIASGSEDGTVLLWNVTSDGSLDVKPVEKQWTTWGQIKTTRVLQNYPNPFNPETWIPYQLAQPSDVSITIYDIRGNVVRKLLLGHKQAGFYTDRNRAAHWDGRNNTEERVANGVYFIQLKAGDSTYLRKMLIVK